MPSFFSSMLRPQPASEERRRPSRRHTMAPAGAPPPLVPEEGRRRSSAGTIPKAKAEASVPTLIHPARPPLSSSQTSTISEVTMMTYTQERAEMAREELFRRADQLGADEGRALMSEVQQEFEAKTKEKKRNEETRRGSGDIIGWCRRSFKSESTPEGRELPSTFSLARTAKIDNSSRRGEGRTISLSPGEDEMNIEEIIELKLLVANQQAAIDTLSSQLHNVELSHRQQRHANQSRLETLEAQNQDLADQLNDCQEREIELRRELRLSRELRSSQEANQGEDNDALMRENAELRRRLAAAGSPVDVGRKRRSIATATTASSDEGSVARTL